MIRAVVSYTLREAGQGEKVEFDEGGNFRSARVRTKDGEEVLIRPVRPDDEEALRQMFRSSSGETLYTRFLSPGLGVPLRYIRRLMAHNPPAVMALVAEAGEGEKKRIVALLNAIETDPGAVELAIMVVDDYQNRGLGSMMSRCLLEIAARQGTKKFTADIDASNRRVFHLIKRSGLPTEITIDQGIAHVEIMTTPAEESAVRQR